MTIAQRFYSQGGQLFADRRPVSLEWAEEAVSQWFRDARRERMRGNHRLADEYRRQAMALSATIIKAEDEAHKSSRDRVRHMLRASLEQDGAA